MQFGDILRAKRLSLGWTQQQLADRIGRSKNNISQYETNKREPDFRTLCLLAGLLRASLDELLDYRAPGSAALAEPRGLSGYSRAPLRLPVFARWPLENALGYRLTDMEGLPEGPYFYFVAPDAALAGHRILPGDLLLIRETNEAEDAQPALVLLNGEALLRLVGRCPGGRALLNGSGAGFPSQLVDMRELRVIGKVLRVEFPLP